MMTWTSLAVGCDQAERGKNDENPLGSASGPEINRQQRRRCFLAFSASFARDAKSVSAAAGRLDR
jgi:hypothetical protein